MHVATYHWSNLPTGLVKQVLADETRKSYVNYNFKFKFQLILVVTTFLTVL